MNDSLGTKNPSIDSPCFQKPSHAFTIQNQHNLKWNFIEIYETFIKKLIVRKMKELLPVFPINKRKNLHK